MVQFDNGTPIYLQIIQEMTLRILSGTLQPGQKLPSVRELALEFGVNPNTMQRAMAQMEQDGLVHTKRTSGRFLTDQPEIIKQKREDFAKAETKRYLAYMQKIGFTDTAQIIDYLQHMQ